METITKKRALKHIERVQRVKDNCKNIPSESDYTVIGSGLDKGAFRVEGKTLYLAIDGSSRLGEWISNLNVLSKEGMHRGFRRQGSKLYGNLMKKIPHHISYYDTIIADGHSRGAPLVEVVLVRIYENLINNELPTINMNLVSSGAPVLYTEKMIKKIVERNVYTHHALRTGKDFITKVNAPKGLIFKKFWKRLRLHHYTTYVYNLPTVKRKIDHLSEAYEKSIIYHWGEVKIKGHKLLKDGKNEND